VLRNPRIANILDCPSISLPIWVDALHIDIRLMEAFPIRLRDVGRWHLGSGRNVLSCASLASDVSSLRAFGRAMPTLIVVFLPSAELPPFVLSRGADSIEQAG